MRPKRTQSRACAGRRLSSLRRLVVTVPPAVQRREMCTGQAVLPLWSRFLELPHGRRPQTSLPRRAPRSRDVVAQGADGRFGKGLGRKGMAVCQDEGSSSSSLPSCAVSLLML